MLYMNSQLITRFKATYFILGDVSDGFGDDGVFWYDFMSELVSKINGYVLVDTGGLIQVYTVGFHLVALRTLQ